MGRYFALTLNIPAQTQTKNKAKPTKIREWNLAGFGMMALVLFLVLSVVYLVQVNTVSTKGYEIQNLQNQLNSLKDANKRLELESASLKSIQNLQDSVKHLNLVPSGKVFYVGANGYAFQNN